MTLIDYLRLRTSQLRHLAGGGDPTAKDELARRQREASPPPAVARLTYRELRTQVLAWRDGATAEEQAQSRATAESAQRELEARFRVRARLGWRAEDAETFGPLDPEELPAPPWLVPPAATTRSWRRPAGSTHYRSDEDVQRDAIRALASQFYGDRAAGVPRK